MEPIRILVADDHPIFRDGLRLLLDSVEDTTLVGQAGSGEEAVQLTQALQPDVVLMDIQMPGINGIEAARRIVQADPHIKVLMLTMFEDDDSLFSAMRAGASGYLLKGARQDETLRAIRAVANGEAIFSPQVARRVIQYFNAARPAAPPSTFPKLTEREYEILNLIVQRLNNTEIAERLVLSQKTVRNHVSSIFHKLQVADRAEAILAARLAGLGEDG
jgi:DNA-binding NarL/FixJ family response regulator